ncbi:MAG TPA: hypothetical protein VLX90_11430 [Steroidobacteraceae bacterium]|nr:hypothetical protein [Steroidobacteraceae bacterium]
MKTPYLAVLAAAAVAAAFPAHAGWISAAVNTDLSRHLAGIPRQPATVIAPAPTVRAAGAATIAMVTDPERAQLIKSIDDLSHTAARNAKINGSVAIDLALAAIALGVTASIAAFCRFSSIAGVLSILATASVGANNALPFRDDANTYKFVSAESHALLLNARLNPAMTEEDFKGYTEKLSALATYGDDKDVTGSPEQLQELVDKLHPAAEGQPKAP